MKILALYPNREANMIDAIRAEVIVPGLASMTGWDTHLQNNPRFPVWDGVTRALFLTEGQIRARLGISRASKHAGGSSEITSHNPKERTHEPF